MLRELLLLALAVPGYDLTVFLLELRQIYVDFLSEGVEVEVVFTFCLLVQTPISNDQVLEVALSEPHRVEGVQIVVLVISLGLELGLSFENVFVLANAPEEVFTHFVEISFDDEITVVHICNVDTELGLQTLVFRIG